MFPKAVTFSGSTGDRRSSSLSTITRASRESISTSEVVIIWLWVETSDGWFMTVICSAVKAMTDLLVLDYGNYSPNRLSFQLYVKAKLRKVASRAIPSYLRFHHTMSDWAADRPHLATTLSEVRQVIWYSSLPAFQVLRYWVLNCCLSPPIQSA